jgi:hypothetical protein
VSFFGRKREKREKTERVFEKIGISFLHEKQNFPLSLSKNNLLSSLSLLISSLLFSSQTFGAGRSSSSHSPATSASSSSCITRKCSPPAATLACSHAEASSAAAAPGATAPYRQRWLTPVSRTRQRRSGSAASEATS